jgi:hypothetical protein
MPFPLSFRQLFRCVWHNAAAPTSFALLPLRALVYQRSASRIGIYPRRADFDRSACPQAANCDTGQQHHHQSHDIPNKWFNRSLTSSFVHVNSLDLESPNADHSSFSHINSIPVVSPRRIEKPLPWKTHACCSNFTGKGRQGVSKVECYLARLADMPSRHYVLFLRPFSNHGSFNWHRRPA